MESPALLVHSGGFTSRQWKRLALRLEPKRRVLAPDLLGYGPGRAWPVGKPFHFADDLAMLEERLAELGEPAHVVGHSYGGFLALKLALARPDAVRSVAVYEPVTFGILDEPADADAHAELARVPPQYVPDENGVDESWLAGFVDWWNGPGSWSKQSEEMRAAFRSVGWKLSQEVASLSADVTDRAGYAAIRVPTLLLGGALTPRVERRVLEKLAATLPRATLQMLPNAGHMGPITHAEIVNDAIEAHIDRSAASK